jgi:hypothetical protein
VQDIQDNRDKNFNMSIQAEAEKTYELVTTLSIPRPDAAAAKEVAVCARSWRWEWFAMFFQFAIVASALVVTMMPNRLLRARYPLAVMLAIATVIIMVSTQY